MITIRRVPTYEVMDVDPLPAHGGLEIFLLKQTDGEITAGFRHRRSRYEGDGKITSTIEREFFSEKLADGVTENDVLDAVERLIDCFKCIEPL